MSLHYDDTIILHIEGECLSIPLTWLPHQIGDYVHVLVLDLSFFKGQNFLYLIAKAYIMGAMVHVHHGIS